REGRHPFELLEEIDKTLALDTAPLSWPVGSGRTFAGVYDLQRDAVRRMDKEDETPRPMATLDAAAFADYLPESDGAAMAEERAIPKSACLPFDLNSFREGHLTPVLFGSALRNFGVRDLIDGLGVYAPPPRSQQADTRLVAASEP